MYFFEYEHLKRFVSTDDIFAHKWKIGDRAHIFPSGGEMCLLKIYNSRKLIHHNIFFRQFFTPIIN